ncbi:Na+/H+ antiporter [Nocardiopsis ansamitocini]|uniref:Na+/H+ antiporter n=1 Tax=Nocardiopsis ansamitocini TaxID=1670832 RepID=A0A9W6UK75_9ACTN|nr:Na+/H+ antiporter [Nocardiopsis ansamitocini]GLU49639.1 Na+/H+ antiporter [Nocardiopsis ansamitocini]
MSAEHYVLAGLVIVLMVLAGRVIAPRLRLPDAIVLVPLGFAVSFVPGMESIHVDPDVVLLVFLPPLIYNAAFFSAPREMRAEARPIVALAVGMTLVTAFAVAAAAVYLLPDTAWPAAIALGAAVAPTDAVASSAVLKRVGAPKRVMTILEGESLINDGVALTLFSLAVTAMAVPLTPVDGVVELVKVVAGGLAYGFVVAVAVTWVRTRLHDDNTQLVVALLTPFIAYVPAELMGFSGVLAAVIAGFYLGTRGSGLLPPRVRVTGQTVWKGLVMLLESVLFVLLGLQLHEVLTDVAGLPFGQLAAAAVAVIVAAIGVRMLWEVVVSPVMRRLPGRLRLDSGPLAQRVVIGWSGMRGAISLAIALSLPLTLEGEEFGDRNLLIFMAASVVLATLIGQGMTLPLLLRRLGVRTDSRVLQEIASAETAMGRAAMDRLDELIADERVDADTARAHRQMHELLVTRAREVLADADTDPSTLDRAKETFVVRREVGAAQRLALTRLYRKGEIGHDVYQNLQRELDLKEPPLP